jgi:hypothetical protein
MAIAHSQEIDEFIYLFKKVLWVRENKNENVHIFKA